MRLPRVGRRLSMLPATEIHSSPADLHAHHLKHEALSALQRSKKEGDRSLKEKLKAVRQ